MKPGILEKSVGDVKICISCFVAKHNPTHRVATDKTQQDPCEVEAKAQSFSSIFTHYLIMKLIILTTSWSTMPWTVAGLLIALACALSTYTRLRMITSASLLLPSSLPQVGRSSQWWRLMVGQLLTRQQYNMLLMLLFICLLIIYYTGNRNRTITKCKLCTLTNNLHYACQTKAWFDKSIMLFRVQYILKPLIS